VLGRTDLSFQDGTSTSRRAYRSRQMMPVTPAKRSASLTFRRRRSRPQPSAKRGAQDGSVTHYLLGININRNITNADPSDSLLAWMGAQKDDDLFLAPLIVAEIRRGILEKPFDEKAGLGWARLMANGKAKSRPRSALGTIAVAEANMCCRNRQSKKLRGRSDHQCAL